MRCEVDGIITGIFAREKIRNDNELTRFFENFPAVLVELQSGIESSTWINTRVEANDGWYCVQNAGLPETWKIYYQERGAVRWGEAARKSHAAAISCLLIRSGHVRF